MKGRLRAAILAVALVAPSIAKGAEADAEPVRVRFDAYPGCPDAARFFDQIRARTVHVRLAKDGEVARTLRVSVVRDHGRSVGRVVIEEATQASVPRSVEAVTCAEAVDALALIAALSIDPNASTAPNAEPPAEPAVVADPPIAPVAPAGPVAPVAPAPASTNVLPVSHEEAGAAPAPIAASRWVFASGLGVDAVSLGSVMASPRVLLDLTRDAPSVLAPSLRLSAARAAVDVSGASASQTARMTWLTGALAVCPLHFVAQRIAVCADVEAGILEGHPVGTGTRARTRAWIAPGLSVRLRVATLAFARRGELFLEAEPGARLPILRDEFYFEPNSTVYKAPAVVLRAGLTAGMRFW